jgi:hypothetical protein
MAIGLGGSLDSAVSGDLRAGKQVANKVQAEWRRVSNRVLGVAMKYSVSEIADRNVGVIAKIRKSAPVPLEPTYYSEHGIDG